MDEECCEDCDYFRQTDGNNGSCCRFPPKENSAHPIVGKGFWCGEWKPNLEKIGLRYLEMNK